MTSILADTTIVGFKNYLILKSGLLCTALHVSVQFSHTFPLSVVFFVLLGKTN